MAKRYCIVWRAGGTHNFEWRRTAPEHSRPAVELMCEVIQRMGYRAHVADYGMSMKIGLPDTFDPPPERKRR